MFRSDPKSKNYGKHLTSDEVVRMFAPEETAVNAVKDWLNTAGVALSRLSQSVNKQVKQ